MVILYVDAMNTPGTIPNVQTAWDLFVQIKCSDAKKVSQQKYSELMNSLLPHGKLPCDNAEIRMCHNSALEETESLFMEETTGISTNTVEKQMRQLKVTHLSHSQDTGQFLTPVYFSPFSIGLDSGSRIQVI